MTDTTTPPAKPVDAAGGAAEAAPTERRADKPMTFGAALMAFFSSYGLTVAILLCLMMLVYWGTRLQEPYGLNRAVHELFDAWVCTINLHDLHPSYTWPFTDIPLAFRWPGAMLLLSLLTVNIICGGIVRLKHGKRTLGVLITHLSVLWLLLAGLMQAVYGTRGNVRFYPDQVVKEYVSFDGWELSIGVPKAEGKTREYLVPAYVLAQEGVLRHADLPFEVRVARYYNNCEVRQAKNPAASDAIGGLYLHEIPFNKEMRQIPGIVAEVLVGGDVVDRSLVWGLQQYPWTVSVDGAKYTLDLRLQVFDLPFGLRLEKFRHEKHPGVNTPRHFSSDVTKLGDGAEQEFHIKMNQPMRYAGYMFSQNSWGPQDPGHPGPYYSVLEVSTNPADRWQMWACITIGFGMCWHFLYKFIKFIRAQLKRLTALREAAV